MTHVWLIRSDVRNHLIGSASSLLEAQKNFTAWWITQAPLEYSNLPYPPNPVLESALEGVSTLDGLEVSRLMQFLRHALVPDLDDKAFIRWFALVAIPEFKLLPFIRHTFLQYAQDPAPEVQQDTSRPLTRLMLWVWESRDDLKAAFSLAHAQGREGFVAWFYVEGILDMQLFDLLSQKEVAWLQMASSRIPKKRSPAISHHTYFWFIKHHGFETLIDWENPAIRAEMADRATKSLAENGIAQPLQRILNGAVSFQSRFTGTTPDQPLSPSDRILSRPFGVNLVGHGLGSLGIGEDVRMLGEALKAVDIPFCILNRRSACDSEEAWPVITHFSLELPYAYTIVVLTGFDTATLRLDRPDIFDKTFVIGYWPWEIPVWPKVWQGALSLVDEIWASSTYTRNALQQSSPVPVTLMPMAVTLDEVSNLGRTDFDLPEKTFLFLFVFDFRSYLTRKNPWAAIEAFKRAFPKGDEPVGLVLKVSNIDPSEAAWQAFKTSIEGDLRIILIDRNFPRADIPALMRACDSYVSLHRAEGFGRTLAEALLMERSVIATDFSGNTDFVTEETGYPVPFGLIQIPEGEYPFSDGAFWADPDIESAARIFQKVFDHPTEAREKAKLGKALILSRHGAHPVGEAVRSRLLAISHALGDHRFRQDTLSNINDST